MNTARLTALVLSLFSFLFDFATPIAIAQTDDPKELKPIYPAELTYSGNYVLQPDTINDAPVYAMDTKQAGPYQFIYIYLHERSRQLWVLQPVKPDPNVWQPYSYGIGPNPWSAQWEHDRFAIAAAESAPMPEPMDGLPSQTSDEQTLQSAPLTVRPMPKMESVSMTDVLKSIQETAKRDPNYRGSVLAQDTWLEPGQYLLSENARYKFGILPTGELYISSFTQWVGEQYKIQWMTESKCKGKCRLSVQPDGNMVLYDYEDAAFTQRTAAIWESGAKPNVIESVRPAIRAGTCFAQLQDKGEITVCFGIPPDGARTELWESYVNAANNPVNRTKKPQPTPIALTLRNKLGNPPARPGENIRTWGVDSPLANANGNTSGQFSGSLKDRGGNLDAQGSPFDVHIVNLKSDTKYLIQVIPSGNGFEPALRIEDGNGDLIVTGVTGASIKPSDEGIASGAKRLIVGKAVKDHPGNHYTLRITPPAEMSTSTPSTTPAQAVGANSKGNILAMNATLEPDTLLRSFSGIREARMQADGNFVIYNYGHPIWYSKTDRKGPCRMVMQADGNLVIYPVASTAKPNSALWESRATQLPLSRGESCYAKLLDSGNLAVYAGTPDGDSRPLWFTTPVQQRHSPDENTDNQPEDLDELPAPNAMRPASLDALRRAPRLVSQAAEAALVAVYKYKNPDSESFAARYDDVPLTAHHSFQRLGLGENPKITFFRMFGEKQITFMVASDNDNVIIAFRGTETDSNWESNGIPQSLSSLLSVENARPVLSEQYDSNLVHRGWMEAVNSIWGELTTTLDAHQARHKTVAVTGHSLGGSLAGYTMFLLMKEGKYLNAQGQHVLATFAAPHFAYKSTNGAPLLASFEFIADISIKGNFSTIPGQQMPCDFGSTFFELRKRKAPNLVVYTVESVGANGITDWVTSSWDPAGLVKNALDGSKLTEASQAFGGFTEKLFGKKIDPVNEVNAAVRSQIADAVGTTEPLGNPIRIPSAYNAAGKVHDPTMSYYNVLEAFHLLKQDDHVNWVR